MKILKKHLNVIAVHATLTGFVQVMENLESHGIYDFNFQAWEVKEFQ